MKILHCLAQLPSHTGSGIYYWVLADGFKKLGYENAFLYAIQDPFKPKVTEGKVYEVSFLSDDLDFPIAGMSDEMPYNSTIYSGMNEDMLCKWKNAFTNMLYKAREEFKPDIVISHHLFMLTSIVKGIFHDIPVIGISHGTDLRQIKKYPYFRELHMEYISELDGCIAIAPKDIHDIENIIGINKNKIKVMGGGFDSRIFYRENCSAFSNDKIKTRSHDRISILYAGKISYSKGVYELANAIPEVIKKHPDICIDIIGNASEAQISELMRLSENFKHLTISPALPQPELARKMRESDIFVLPSYYEGLGLVNIEALASGCLVATTSIESLIWLLGDRVNSSGIIEYIKLPRLFDTDKPYKEDKPEFIKNLANALSTQIKRVKEGFQADDEVYSDIYSHSWDGIINKIDVYIKQLISDIRQN